MIQIMLPVIVGVLLLGILFYWLLQTADPPRSGLNFDEAHNALRSLQSDFIPVPVIDRVCDDQDMAFVSAEGNRELATMLNRERRKIVVLWLRRVRQRVRLLFNFHIKSARYNARLGPMLEVRLGFQFLIFLTTYYALLTLVLIRGPFQSRRIAGSIATALRNFCVVSQKALAIADAWQTRIPGRAGTGSPANS